jgi:hypothetical protein
MFIVVDMRVGFYRALNTSVVVEHPLDSSLPLRVVQEVFQA